MKIKRRCLLKHQSTTSPVCPESLASKRVPSEGAVEGILFDTSTSWVFIVDVKQPHGDHNAFFRLQVCPAKFRLGFTVPCCHSNTSIKFHGHFQRAGTLCSFFFDVFLSIDPFVFWLSCLRSGIASGLTWLVENRAFSHKSRGIVKRASFGDAAFSVANV